MINQNETYQGNINVKKDGVQMGFTEHEVIEYAKCKADPVYFAVNYLKVIHPDHGLVPFKLYPYQEKMFEHFNINRFSIVLACRQSGKSISSVAYILWYAVFHSEQVIAVIANKGSTAREMLGRITLMLENLPFFLQPGCRALNKGSIEFSNNSRIIAAATSGSSIRGMSCNLIFLDEFAFVERAAEFYTSTYPVISSGKSTKVIITSTANGIGNQFHDIWSHAEAGTNNYVSFRVDWWDVPGRDKAWKEETIANTSQIQFDQEFGNTFLGTGDTLIDAECLMGMKAIEPIRVLESQCIRQYKDPIKDHAYICTVDVSKGIGGDYSTFSIFDISTRPFEQVCVYRHNKISPILFPDIIVKYCKSYNNAYVVVESNDQGGIVCNGIYYEIEYEEFHIESTVKSNNLGVMMNKKIKRLGCSSIKDVLESNKLKLYDKQTIRECLTFVAKGASYEASEGNHDDLMMNLVMFGYFVGTDMFSNMTDIDLKRMLYDKQVQAIEADILPFGFIDTAEEIIDEYERNDDPYANAWAIDYDHHNF